MANQTDVEFPLPLRGSSVIIVRRGDFLTVTSVTVLSSHLTRSIDQPRLVEEAILRVDELVTGLEALLSHEGTIPSPRNSDPNPDALLTLRQAAELPELRGAASGAGRGAVTVRMMRHAINAGRLQAVRPAKRKTLVTRTQIKEWLSTCQDIAKNLTSSNARPATTKMAGSPTKQHGSSRTGTPPLQQEAVTRILKELRSGSTSIMSESTRSEAFPMVPPRTKSSSVTSSPSTCLGSKARSLG